MRNAPRRPRTTTCGIPGCGVDGWWKSSLAKQKKINKNYLLQEKLGRGLQAWRWGPQNQDYWDMQCKQTEELRCTKNSFTEHYFPKDQQRSWKTPRHSCPVQPENIKEDFQMKTVWRQSNWQRQNVSVKAETLKEQSLEESKALQHRKLNAEPGKTVIKVPLQCLSAKQKYLGIWIWQL